MWWSIESWRRNSWSSWYILLAVTPSLYSRGARTDCFYSLCWAMLCHAETVRLKPDVSSRNRLRAKISRQDCACKWISTRIAFYWSHSYIFHHLWQLQADCNEFHLNDFVYHKGSSCFFIQNNLFWTRYFAKPNISQWKAGKFRV